jgi:tRNA A-37 threonylcarbamoyl transferase component Bud32
MDDVEPVPYISVFPEEGVNRSLLNQRYVPLRKIAAGGMGEIYLARQTGVAGFQRQVVLKRIHRRLSDNTRAVEMFLNEARLAAGLSHPNIVQIYDVGEEDGAYFIVMERIVGAGLRELAETATRKGQMIPMELSITIIAQVLEGLRYAHNFKDETGRPLRIVHRDVGPTNILVSYDGAVKLLDFGIARAEDQLRQENGSAPGKFAYMAPEAVVGEPVDARSDLFSVGVLLYELTVGQRLFRAASFEAMRRVVDDPIPPPTFSRAGYPVDLEILVMRALERNPADRFASAEEMLDELEQFAFDTGMRLSRLRLGRFVSQVMGITGAISHAGAEEGDHAAEDLDFDKGLFGAGKPETIQAAAAGGQGRESSALEAIKQANEAIAELVAAADQLGPENKTTLPVEDEEGATIELRPAAQAQLRAHTVPAEEEPKDGSALIVTDDLVEEVSDLEDEDEEEILDGPPPTVAKREEITRRYPAKEEDRQGQQETVVVETISDEDVVEEPPEEIPEEPEASQELRLALADISKELEAATEAGSVSDRERRERLEAIVRRTPAGSDEIVDQLLGPRELEIVEKLRSETPTDTIAEPPPELEEDELERVDGTGRRPLDELELVDHPEGDESDELFEEPLDEEDDGLDDRTIELGEESLEVVEDLAVAPPELPEVLVDDDGLDDDNIPSSPAIAVEVAEPDGERVKLSFPRAEEPAPRAWKARKRRRGPSRKQQQKRSRRKRSQKPQQKRRVR